MKLRLAVAVCAALAVAAAPAAQPAASPRNLAGTWTLNSWLSDPADQIQNELRADIGSTADADIFSGPQRVEPGRGAGRRGERGGPRGRSSQAPRLSAEDQQRIRSLLELAQSPAVTLTITTEGDAITIADPVRGSRTLHATGAKTPQTFDSGALDATTRWEGPALQTDYDAGHGVTLRISFMLAPPSNVLLVRFTFIYPGNQAAPFVIRHVYDRQA